MSTCDEIRAAGIDAWIVGEVVDVAATGGARYLEGTIEPLS
jgi:hypothetical protein